MSNAKIEVFTPNYKIDSNSPFSQVLGRKYVITHPSSLVSNVLGFAQSSGVIRLPPAPNGSRYWAVAQGTYLSVKILGDSIYHHFTIPDALLPYIDTRRYISVLAGWVTYGLFKDIEQEL